MRKSRIATVVLLSVCAVAVVGCKKAYRITDSTNTGEFYFAKNYKKQRDGEVTFTDGKSKSKITLQSPYIEEITKKEYDKELKR